MTSKVVTPDKGEVYLGGTFFPLAKRGRREGVVQSLDVTMPPEKRLEGDITRTSNPNLSNISWSDFRGGIGLDVMEGDQTNRCWTANCNIRFPRSLVLPPLVNYTSVIYAADQYVFNISEFNDFVYASSGSDRYKKWTSSSDSWGTNIGGQDGQWSIDIVLDGTEYLVNADSTNTYWSTDPEGGGGLSTSTTNSVALLEWDGRLWGIAHDGEMWYAFTPGTEVQVAPVPMKGSTLRTAYVYRTVTGEDAIHIVTSKATYVYDAANDIHHKIDLFPVNPGSDDPTKKRAAIWRGAAYVGINQALFEQRVTSSGNDLRIVGFPDDGLDDSFDESWRILGVYASINEVFVAIAKTSSEEVSVLAWDGQGWYTIMPIQGGTGDGLVSAAYDKYRLYIGSQNSSGHGRMAYIDLPQFVLNPKNTTTSEYAVSGELKTPWFHADQVDVDKLAVRLKVETADTSTTGTVESVKIEYAVDYLETASSTDDQYLTLANSTFTDGLIDTDTTGVTQTIFQFPKDTADVSVAPIGKAFRAIRFKISLARGGTATKSPRLISMTMEYRKKYERKEGYQFIVDLSDRYKGKTAAGMRSTLQTLVQSNTLSEFTFRDDTGGTRNYYVDVRTPSGEEMTGHMEYGQTLVEVKEL